ncbi:MAG: MBL fold metallo-hydrolase [Erysipelotrichales bacterium]|nr:MBL fold metallo-hydrolase [Erysipelotrichales bacterium]
MKISTLVYENEFCANTHVLYLNEHEVVAFDLGQSTDSFSRYLKKRNLTLIAVFLTHGHFDHIRYIDKIDRNIPVYIHKDDVELISNAYKNCSVALDIPVECKREVIPLEDNDIVEIKDYKIKIINTPFHTNGSSVYLINNAALISGDTLFKGSIGRSDLPSSSPRLINSSLRKILDLYLKYGDMNVYPGHDENTTLKQEIERNFYFKNIK